MIQTMINSGYVNPVVKLLNPSTTMIQYVSDTVSLTAITAASTSHSQSDKMGLFVPNGTYDANLTFTNKNY